MIVKANEGQLSSDRKSVQLVVVVGTGSSRKSVTVHARYNGADLVGPNPFYGKEVLEKLHRDAQAVLDSARAELDEARRHEQAMFTLAFKRRPWMVLTGNEVAWHEFAIDEALEAGKKFSAAFHEMNKVEEKFPLLVQFECGKIIPSGKKPKAEARRLAFA